MGTDLSGNEVLGFRLKQLLGEGGMGSVWLAEHPVTGVGRAVKVLDPLLARDAQLVERFVQEARIMMGLEHQNIVRVENFSREHLAMVMELVRGDTLSDLIGRKVGPIPIDRALPLMRQILEGVGHAHAQGVVHRDIKPSNIMVTPAGMAKVMDFGIARVVRSSRLTRTGTAMGTAAYMSPEQIKGAKDADERSDIYSLGVTFYEMLAGRPPFEAGIDSESDFQLKLAQVQQAAPDPRTFYPGIPEPVVQSVLQALEKEPDARQQSTEQLYKELLVAAGVPGTQPARDTMSGDAMATPVIQGVSAATAPAAGQAPMPAVAIPPVEHTPTTPGQPQASPGAIAAPASPAAVEHKPFMEAGDFDKLADSYAGNELASLKVRFLAALIDGAIQLVVAFLLVLILQDAISGMGEAASEIVFDIIIFLSWVAIHGKFIQGNGQTLGKRILGIKMVQMDGADAGFARLVLYRTGSLYLVYIIVSLFGLPPTLSMMFGLADVLFIFSKERRCLHDLIAGTKVVKV